VGLHGGSRRSCARPARTYGNARGVAGFAEQVSEDSLVSGRAHFTADECAAPANGPACKEFSRAGSDRKGELMAGLFGSATLPTPSRGHVVRRGSTVGHVAIGF